jgi:DNA repair photolyase
LTPPLISPYFRQSMADRSDPDPVRPILRGRGAHANPANRFERLHYAEDADVVQPDPDAPPAAPLRTQFFRDPSRSVISSNQSPDVPFDTSLNPYRGCEHGCIYCYARPTHEYLGFSAGLDFETKILVKPDVAALLRAELGSPDWRPRLVAIGGVTDPYQPVEKRLRLTRACLEVFAEFRNPCAVVTKSGLVARDIDLLQALARHDAVRVYVSVTTLDPALHRILEPRASAPHRRLATIESLARAGVPVGALVAPVIPGLTDHEAPAIVAACARAGARSVRHILLRLPHGLAPLFEAWLDRHFPERKAKVWSRIRAMREGRVSDPRFHSRMRGSGVFAEQMHALFALACRRAGLVSDPPPPSTKSFRRPNQPQLSLFSADG